MRSLRRPEVPRLCLGAGALVLSSGLAQPDFFVLEHSLRCLSGFC